uniref:L1 transposable element RRM domain-containing protein n=1 Tax=Cyclopterus lumpus TaxID=8103 RepID=A0A8C2W6V4_CYCLU
MAEKLQKYKYKSGGSSSRPTRTTRQIRPGDPDQPSPTRSESPGMTERMKADILSSLKGEISKIIREELKSALAEDFNSLKSELQAVRSEISKNMTAIQTEVDHMKADIQDVKGGLSTWSDEVAAQEVTITSLQRQVTTLTDRCEDMEGRMRRCNIRIAGIQEQPDSSSPNTVAKVIKEVLQLDRDIKIDRSHRTAATRKPGDREKPRVIIAKVHNDGDAAEILRRARERAPLVYNGNRISIFPDYTPSVAKARAAFTDIRRTLRGRKGVRYGLLYPARLRISHNNEDEEFLDPGKAMEYVRKKVIPSTEAAD